MLSPPTTATTTTAILVAPSAMDDTATEEILSYDLTEETFTPHDVVLGKGNGINCLPGNVQFRQIIAKYKPLYNSTPRSLKGGVAELVINQVACMDPPGRFLEATTDKRFKQVPRKRAIEKTCQALREKKTGIKLSATAAGTPSSSSVSSSHGPGKTSPTNSTTSPRASPHPFPSPPVGTASAVPAVFVMVPSIPVQKAPHPPLSPPTLETAARLNWQPRPASTTGPRRVDDMKETPMPPQNATSSADSAASDPETQEQRLRRQTPVWPIRENDVLYGGRGRKHFHRLANQRFLELVKYRRNDYHESSSKKNVALCILEEWKNQTPPGRFLQQDAKSEKWYEISTAKIQEKTCQALRDLKRERGPGGVRPTIADRMVDPSNRSNISSGNHQQGTTSSNSSSGDEGNINRGNHGSSNSSPEHVQHSEHAHHHLESHVHQLPPQYQHHHQQHQMENGPPPPHHIHPHQPQHQHSGHQPYHRSHQQCQQQPHFAPHPQGPPPQHYPQHSQQPIYSNPSPPQQQHQQQRHHHALPPMHDPPISPLSPHDHVYVSHPPMPSQGSLLPLSPQGPTSPSHQHPSMSHHHSQFSPLHTPPVQNGWFQDPNSPIYSPHNNAPHNSRVMMHESYPPPMGHVHHQQPHHSQQYPHSLAPSAPATYHLAARPSPPPPPPAYYQGNHSYSSHGAASTSVPPPPPLPRNVDQDPYAAAIHRQAHIVALEMRKMDEMMRRASPGCGPPPPQPPPAHHLQPVPRTVVATTTAPLSPPLPPSNHQGQVPMWHGQDQAEMMRPAPGATTMPETRYGQVAVNPTPHYHYSPHTSAASHGSSGSYQEAVQQHHQQQLSPVTNSIVSTSSAAGGSSSISINSSGDLSHPPVPLIPTKAEETTMMRQVTMNTSTFAPIQSEDDVSSKSYGGDDHAAVPKVNALARVVVQSVPVSPPRGQRNDTHNKMMIHRKKKVDTTSPLRKGSNTSCPAVKAKNSLPIKAKPMKKLKASTSPKNKACSTLSPPTKKPSATNKSAKESPLQGELEAASLLANMFAA